MVTDLHTARDVAFGGIGDGISAFKDEVILIDIALRPLGCLLAAGEDQVEGDIGQVDRLHAEDAECGDGIESECAACAEDANALFIEGDDRLIGEAVEVWDMLLGDAAVTCEAADARRLLGSGGG